MQVKDIMSEQVVSVSPEETAAVAARLLSRNNIGSLPVCGSDGKIRGLLTDRDIVLRCVAVNSDPQTTKVSQIMSRRVVCVKPEDMAKTAADRMAREQIRRLPVEQGGRLVGMVSLADMAGAVGSSLDAERVLVEVSMNLKRR